MTTAMQAAPSQRFVEHGDPVAIQAVDLVKDYGKGDSTVHALRHVNVAFERAASLRSWALPARANRR